MKDILSKKKILNRKLNFVTPETRASLFDQIGSNHPQTFFICKVHMLMMSQEDSVLANAMDRADYVFADGVPVAWLQSRLCGQKAAVVRGSVWPVG